MEPTETGSAAEALERCRSALAAGSTKEEARA